MPLNTQPEASAAGSAIENRINTFQNYCGALFLVFLTLTTTLIILGYFGGTGSGSAPDGFHLLIVSGHVVTLVFATMYATLGSVTPGDGSKIWIGWTWVGLTLVSLAFRILILAE